MGNIMDDLLSNLKKVLADSYALYLKTQNYHWNVTGSTFVMLHELFEEQYSDLAGAIDNIAERIRQLGNKIPATFTYFNSVKSIGDGREDFRAEQMVTDLAKDQQHMIDLLNTCMKNAQEKKDEVTLSLLIDRVKVHQKNMWILKSIA